MTKIRQMGNYDRMDAALRGLQAYAIVWTDEYGAQWKAGKLTLRTGKTGTVRAWFQLWNHHMQDAVARDTLAAAVCAMLPAQTALKLACLYPGALLSGLDKAFLAVDLSGLEDSFGDLIDRLRAQGFELHRAI